MSMINTSNCLITGKLIFEAFDNSVVIQTPSTFLQFFISDQSWSCAPKTHQQEVFFCPKETWGFEPSSLEWNNMYIASCLILWWIFWIIVVGPPLKGNLSCGWPLVLSRECGLMKLWWKIDVQKYGADELRFTKFLPKSHLQMVSTQGQQWR